MSKRVIAIRVDAETERALREQARADDRPLSAFLRRTLTKIAKEHTRRDAANEPHACQD